MKNLYDVLKQKELELQQLQKEVEALRLASRLLSDENDVEPARTSPIAAAAASFAVPVRSGATSGNGSVVPKQFP